MLNEILLGCILSGSPALSLAESSQAQNNPEHTKVSVLHTLDDRVDVYQSIINRRKESRSEFGSGSIIPFDCHEWYGMRFDEGKNTHRWIYETVVVEGESLDKLAHEFNNTIHGHAKLTWQELYEQNKEIIGDNPNHIEEDVVLQYIFLLPADG